MVAKPIAAPAAPIAAPDAPDAALDAADRFPDFPPRDDMQNTIYINFPAYQSALYLHFGFSDAAIVTSEVPVGWERRQRAGLLIPDLMVAFNVDAGAVLVEGGYAINHQGKPPDFVLEVASKSTSARDEFAKRIGYAAYAIPEYWRFDDTGGDYYATGLAGDRLVDGQYQPLEIVETTHSRYWGYSAALGLYVCWEYGHLRWYDPESGYLPTHLEERIIRRSEEAARAVSDAERIAAEAARRTAESERDAERAARRTAESAQRTAESERDAERAARRAAESERDAERTARLRLEAEIRRLRDA